MYDHAIEIVQDRGKASISMIQKKLRIDFNRAARFIEQMEMDGIIAPQEGSKLRQVIQDGENMSTLGALVTILGSIIGIIICIAVIYVIATA